MFTGAIKELVENDINILFKWKSCEVLELNVWPDHIHLVVSMMPKISVTLMGVLKGKIAINAYKSYPKLKHKPNWGNHLWAQGYFVSIIGLSEDKIRRLSKFQDK